MRKNAAPVVSALNVDGHVPADGLVVVGDPWTLAGGAVEVSAVD